MTESGEYDAYTYIPVAHFHLNETGASRYGEHGLHIIHGGFQEVYIFYAQQKQEIFT